MALWSDPGGRRPYPNRSVKSCQALGITLGGRWLELSAWVGPGQEGDMRVRVCMRVHVCGGVGSVCLGAGLRPRFPTGPAKEVEPQVSPDAGLGARMLGAVGDGQVGVTVTTGVRAARGFRTAWAWGRAGSRLLCPQDGLRQQPQASALPDSVPDLQDMALLLDKLAKENQDIRLLQAQLQVGTSRRSRAGPGVCPGILPRKKVPLFSHVPRPWPSPAALGSSSWVSARTPHAGV